MEFQVFTQLGRDAGGLEQTAHPQLDEQLIDPEQVLPVGLGEGENLPDDPECLGERQILFHTTQGNLGPAAGRPVQLTHRHIQVESPRQIPQRFERAALVVNEALLQGYFPELRAWVDSHP